MTLPNKQEQLIEQIASMPDPKTLRKRADELVRMDEDDKNGEDSLELNYNARGSDRYFWEDGAGQEANIIFKADGENDDSVLVYAYDHESAFNVYGEDAPQLAWSDLPKVFNPLLEEDYLKWDFDDIEEPRRVQATVAIWREHGDTEWQVSPNFLEQVNNVQDNGGFKYAFKNFFVKE